MAGISGRWETGQARRHSIDGQSTFPIRRSPSPRVHHGGSHRRWRLGPQRTDRRVDPARADPAALVPPGLDRARRADGLCEARDLHTAFGDSRAAADATITIGPLHPWAIRLPSDRVASGSTASASAGKRVGGHEHGVAALGSGSPPQTVEEAVVPTPMLADGDGARRRRRGECQRAARALGGLVAAFAATGAGAGGCGCSRPDGRDPDAVTGHVGPAGPDRADDQRPERAHDEPCGSGGRPPGLAEPVPKGQGAELREGQSCAVEHDSGSRSR